MGIGLSTWRKRIGSFIYFNNHGIQDRSKRSTVRRRIPASLSILTERLYPRSFFFLLFLLCTVFFYMLLLLHLHGNSFGTKLLTQQQPMELSDNNLFYLHRFTPRIKCSAEILYSTSITLIPQQLPLRAMDINPNPGPTPHCSEDLSSLSSTVKQRFNDYKRTATKITRHEFHLKTYQYHLQARLVPKGLQPKLRPAIEPVSKNFSVNGMKTSPILLFSNFTC